MEVAGLLHDLATGLQDRGLAAHLVADGDLDALERVDVLGLGTGTELARALGHQGQVHVAAHRTLVHPDVRDVEGLEQVAQRGHVGTCDLGCAVARADDGSGDDLDERHAGAVVVEQRVARTVDTTGGAADVQRLTGVLLHVRALDLHTPGGAVGEQDVEVAVVGGGLVVLRDLVVLRLVRVEVVLPRELARRPDRAVQREADADRGLDGLRVGDRQRSGQADAHRAHLGIGLGAEVGRASAEHLGRGTQLDVHLEAHHRIESGDDLVVLQQFDGGGSHGCQFMRRYPRGTFRVITDAGNGSSDLPS